MEISTPALQGGVLKGKQIYYDGGAKAFVLPMLVEFPGGATLPWEPTTCHLTRMSPLTWPYLGSER
jgi:hypothetical protein